MLTETDKLLRLLDVGRSLVTELDAEAVLQRVLVEAGDITGARYVALGVLDEGRTELERFLTLGIDDAERAAIGDLPRGRGVLGVLIQEPRPLRLAHVGSHPQSYGFPSGHPVMDSFLGVPIMIRGQAWGNLYLTEKQGGEFTEEDEQAVAVLADFAATAIDNARTFEHSERRRLDLEQAVEGLEAARDIADAIGGAGELPRILELVVKRGRALVEARSVLIMLREGEDLVVVASAGHVRDAVGRRIPVARSTSGQVLERRRAERISDVAARLSAGTEAKAVGITSARTALLVPIVYHGAGLGVLGAFDRGSGGEAFTATDEQLLRTFAASAANAVAISRSVEADRLRSTIAAADAERARWGHELHDQTLQALAGMRVALAGALRRDDSDVYVKTMRQAIEDIELEIANLRAIIADLRPSLLDDIGLGAALEALLDRRRDDALAIDCVVSLPEELGDRPGARDLETTIYRLVQESLTNVVKHADATRVEVSVRVEDGAAVVEVRDDGRGFDTTEGTSGFGVAGMRERVFLLGGTLSVTSGGDGTCIKARIPLPQPADRGAPTGTRAWPSGSAR